MKLERHTSSAFDQDLQATTQLFLEIGELVSTQIEQSIEALVNSDIELARKVIAKDDTVNEMEIKLDEMVMRLIMIRQPAANDFRYVMAMSKGVLDLERMGDEACKIASMAKSLAKHDNTLGDKEAKNLSQLVLNLLKNALASFRTFDSDQAIDVVRSDKLINKEYYKYTDEFIRHIKDDNIHIKSGLNVMKVLRSLERIGDHCKNISELVIYATLGKDIRHIGIDEIEQIIEENQSE